MAQGTWVQPGNPLNALNPFNYDLGLTEGLTSIFGGNTKQASTFNNPAVWAQAANPNPQSQVYSYGGTNTAINPVNYQNVNNKTAGTNQQTGGVTNIGTSGDVLGTSSQVPPGPTGPSQEDILRGSINSGWDSYIGQLNDMLNTGIPGQRRAQEQIATNSYNQGISDLDTQRSSSEQAVQTQQATNLNDLTENIKNLFQAGNTYLGSRGAADSSAANQYSYAVTKMGTKERNNIMNQVSDRMNQIGDIYNTESNRLKTELSNNMAGIAQWFNDAQNQLRSQIGQAGLNKQKDIQNLSMQILNQAISSANWLQQQTASRQAQLESWAQSNSKNVQELMANMRSVQQLPAFQGINSGMPQVTPEGNMYVPAGYGNTGTQKKDLFGNPIV